MNMEKMKKWLELTNQYKGDSFWSSVFEQNTPGQFFESEFDFPRYDVYKNDTHHCIVIEAAGLSKEDIQFSLASNSKLIVKGFVRSLYPEEMAVALQRNYGEFEKIIELPEPTDVSSIDIQFFNGLIQVAFPKRIEAIPSNFDIPKENN